MGSRQSLTWRRGSPCALCNTGGLPLDVTAALGESLGCAVCAGHGLTWGPPLAGTGFVVTDPEAVREAASDATQFVDGDVMLIAPTSSPLWGAVVGDRIGLGAGEEPFSTTLLRDGRERLSCSVMRLTRCIWKGRRGAEVAGMVLVVEAIGGTLRWAHAAGGPPAGAAYTLEGVRRPECVMVRELAPLVRGIDEGALSAKRLLLRRLGALGGLGAARG